MNTLKENLLKLNIKIKKMNSYRKYLIDLLLKVNPELDKLILYTLSNDKLINLKNKEMNKAYWKKISYDEGVKKANQLKHIEFTGSDFIKALESNILDEIKGDQDERRKLIEEEKRKMKEK